MTRNPTTPTSRDQPKALYHRPPCASRTMRRTGAAVTLGVAGTRGARGACPHSCAAVLWGARAVRQPCARAGHTRPPAERGRQPRVAFSVAMVPPVGNVSRCLHPASNCRDARHLHPQLRLPVVGGNKGGTVHCLMDAADDNGLALFWVGNRQWRRRCPHGAAFIIAASTRLVKTASSGSFGFQGPGSRLIGSVQQFWLSIGGCDGRQWGWRT